MQMANWGRAPDRLTPDPLSRARRGKNAPKARSGEGRQGASDREPAWAQALRQQARLRQLAKVSQSMV